MICLVYSQTKKGNVMEKLIYGIRSDNENSISYNGFVWPKEGVASAPDWDGGKDCCGGGLHFTPVFGTNQSWNLLNGGKVFRIIVAQKKDVVFIDGGEKCKCKKCEVLLSGTSQECVDYLIKNNIPCMDVFNLHIDYSNATNSGDESNATNSGYKSNATNSGNYSNATNSGDYSNATNSGDESNATNSGYKSNATNSGDESASVSMGVCGMSKSEGKSSICVGEKIELGLGGIGVLLSEDFGIGFAPQSCFVAQRSSGNEFYECDKLVGGIIKFIEIIFG